MASTHKPTPCPSAHLLDAIDRWRFPSSKWEAETIANIDLLPHFAAVRPEPVTLRQGGNQSLDCHNNARRYVENDPTGQWRHVIGWWAHGDLLILHSVISDGTNFGCITPQDWDAPDRFTFIPDYLIDRRVEGNVQNFYRGDRQLPVGLRRRPERHLAAMRKIEKRLQDGMEPDEALTRADQEATGKFR